MGILQWLRNRIGSRQSHSDEGASDIHFEGGNGENVETAIVVRGADSDLAGTWAEFAWMVGEYGQKDKDWKLLTHAHGEYGGREIDTVEVELSNGQRKTVYFDITESFGKWPMPE